MSIQEAVSYCDCVKPKFCECSNYPLKVLAWFLGIALFFWILIVDSDRIKAKEDIEKLQIKYERLAAGLIAIGSQPALYPEIQSLKDRIVKIEPKPEPKPECRKRCKK